MFGYRKGCLQRRTEAGTLTRRLCEHGWQILKERINHIPTLLQIHQQIIRNRNEQLHQVSNYQHLRTAQSTLETVVMDAVIVRNEPHLRARASRHRIQASTNRLGHTVEHTTPYTRCRDINNEEVTGRLGRADHVLARRYKLHYALAQFWTGITIAPTTLLIEMTKVWCWYLVELRTNVASPSSAIFEEGYECINIGTTPGYMIY